MYYLPWWMQWAQAIALIVISCLGSWIALKQARIASAKLNLDLFEKRLKIFEGARGFLAGFMAEGRVEGKDVANFNFNTADVVFLFEEEVTVYLDGLRTKLLAHRTKSRQTDTLPLNDPRKSEWADQLADMEKDLTAEYPRLVEVFKPYLKLRNI